MFRKIVFGVVVMFALSVLSAAIVADLAQGQPNLSQGGKKEGKKKPNPPPPAPDRTVCEGSQMDPGGKKTHVRVYTRGSKLFVFVRVQDPGPPPTDTTTTTYFDYSNPTAGWAVLGSSSK